jgi:hypothetical protein
MCLIQHHYPGIKHDYAWDDLPLIQAFAYKAWAEENLSMIPTRRTTDAYIAQESHR